MKSPRKGDILKNNSLLNKGTSLFRSTKGTLLFVRKRVPFRSFLLPNIELGHFADLLGLSFYCSSALLFSIVHYLTLRKCCDVAQSSRAKSKHRRPLFDLEMSHSATQGSGFEYRLTNWRLLDFKTVITLLTILWTTDQPFCRAVSIDKIKVDHTHSLSSTNRESTTGWGLENHIRACGIPDGDVWKIYVFTVLICRASEAFSPTR